MIMPTAAGWLALLAPPAIVVCAYPYVIGAIKRLMVRHSRYGIEAFAFSASIGQFYKVYLSALVIAITGGLVMLSLAFIPVIGWLAMPFVYFFVGAVIIGYIRSRTTNLVLNSTVLGGRVHLKSSLSASQLAMLYFGNLLAIAFTLGLMIPWAQVRVARYRAEALSLESSSALEGFAGKITQDMGATGEEIGEFFSLDFSL
jgi:uncharacterized membrane protein YjgN (DUF898 family)